MDSYSPSDDLEDFVPYAIELAGALKNTILVDQLPYHYQRREDLIQLLDEHITENIVKVGGGGCWSVQLPDPALTLDRERILPASRWDPTRIGPVVATMLLLLWRSGTPQVQIQRRPRKRRCYSSGTISMDLSNFRCF